MFGFNDKNEKYTFVLVPGGWCGGWCWHPVAERLELAGHHAFPVTFTGSGDRGHLLSAEVSIDTYILDIINLIKYNDLNEIVLVAHSMGGVPTMAVLDRIPDLIRHVVFVDALVPFDEECAMDLIPKEEVGRRIALAQKHDGISLPVPTNVHFADDNVRNWFVRHMTPQPLLPYQGRIHLDHPLGNGIPATYLACTGSHMAAVTLSARRARNMQGWKYLEINSGHNVHIHRPDDVTRILIEASQEDR